jgi:heterodisulfide reductase subunit C
MKKIIMDSNTVTEMLKEASSETLRCMQCGVCSSSCPSGRQTSLNIRKLVKTAGKDTEILRSEELWMCTTCYNCQERCPRGIDIVDTVLNIRAIAAHQSIIFPEHKIVCQMLIKYGHAVPINEESKTKRIEIGLEEYPETVHKYADAMDEVKKLLLSCGFERFTEESNDLKQNTETLV